MTQLSSNTSTIRTTIAAVKSVKSLTVNVTDQSRKKLQINFIFNRTNNFNKSINY